MLLLQQSVACQVRAMDCGQPPLVMVVRALIVTFVPQHESTAVGESKLQGEPQGTVLLGWQEMTGGVVSTTVTN
jgi:hypothetical protein